MWDMTQDCNAVWKQAHWHGVMLWKTVNIFYHIERSWEACSGGREKGRKKTRLLQVTVTNDSVETLPFTFRIRSAGISLKKRKGEEGAMESTGV